MKLEIRAKPLGETDCMCVTHDGDVPLIIASLGYFVFAAMRSCA